MAIVTVAHDAAAFTHVVAQGETLAQIGIKFYGTPRFETALVGANGLDAHGGSAIVAGQSLDIPAPSYQRVVQNETWAELARIHLGDAKRADVLARANGGVSWVQPSTGQEIGVPAVVAHIAADGETMWQLAQRYLGEQNAAWELDLYNGRKGDQKLARGDVVLIPLLEIKLTDEGKNAARLSAERACTQGGGQAYDVRRKTEANLPPLLADVRAGRYLEAMSKGNQMLGAGELPRPQLAVLYRAMVETYVALEAHALAVSACASWRANANPSETRLGPREVSPKIRAACGVK